MDLVTGALHGLEAAGPLALLRDCIVPVTGAVITGREIGYLAREMMADDKIPDLVRFLDVFPEPGVGRSSAGSSGAQ